MNHQQSVETGGEVEASYMAGGGFEVSVYEEPALQVFKKYVIYSELEKNWHTPLSGSMTPPLWIPRSC